MQAPLVKLFLSTQEAGELLDCSADTILKMVRRGELKSERRGRVVKIPRAEVERIVGMRLGPSEDDRERHDLLKEARQLYAELGRVLAKLEA